MNRTIWKYPLEIRGEPQALSMPRSAKILSIQRQRDGLMLWAIVDPGAPAERRTFRIYGTGEPAKRDLFKDGHVGTVQILGGEIVLHVFEDLLG